MIQKWTLEMEKWTFKTKKWILKVYFLKRADLIHVSQICPYLELSIS